MLHPNFNNPGPEWRGKPFWSWNGDLEKEELIRQIHVMKQMGMGGFFMHSRTGLITEYLGEKWFRLINSCADEAEKLGMEAWLYDEDRWPSGSAGGEVTRNPEFRKKLLCLDVFRPDEFRMKDSYLAVFACTLKNETECYDVIPVSPGCSFENGESVLAFSVHEQQEASFFNGFTYVDTLSADATREFMSMTHEKYKQHCGSNFGSKIKGMFTDEPAFGPVFNRIIIANSRPEWQCPWTEKLPELFKQRFGYDLIPRLPELFLRKDGKAVSQVKWHYLELLQQLFIENFAIPCLDWCRENNLILTGHIIEEGRLLSQTTMTGSVMRYYEHMDYPGMDLLTEGNRDYWIARQVSSVARQTGKKWVLSELYGCTGWQMNFKSHKAVGDWQTLFGVNLRCHHLSWYTMQGEAKRDYPASILHQSAWWKDYDIVETYFSRFGYMLSQGDACCDTLVLNPVESVWCQLYPGAAESFTPIAPAIKELEEKYETLFLWLAGNHVDFDYADEEMLSRLYKVEKKDDGTVVLFLGQAAYRAVVVSGMTTMRKTTLDILRAFSDSGGAVVFHGEPPLYVDAEESSAPGDLADTAHSIPYEKAPLAEYCKKHATSPVWISNAETGEPVENIFCRLMKDGDSFILAALNVNRDNPTGPVTVRVNVQGFVEEWDCLTGEKFAVDAADANGGLEFVTDFHPAGSRVFRIVAEHDADLQPRPRLEEQRRHTVSGPFEYSLDEPNVCVLDIAKFEIDDGEWQRETEILKIDRAVRSHFGLPLRAGDMIQPWFREKYHAEDAGKQLGKVTLAFDFAVDKLPEKSPALCMETPEEFTVLLNGHKIEFPEEPEFWIDICFRKADVPLEFLKTGANTLRVETSFRADVNLEALFLIGEFGVKLDGAKKTIVQLPETLAPSCLTEQGLPFYSGAVRYKIPLDCSVAEDERLFLAIPSYEGALIKVNSNGVTVKAIPWEPNEADITETVAAGENEIELEIVLTRKNTFGPLHETERKPAFCGPPSFVTEGSAFSDGYVLYPAGLLAPPVLSCKLRLGIESAVSQIPKGWDSGPCARQRACCTQVKRP